MCRLSRSTWTERAWQSLRPTSKDMACPLYTPRKGFKTPYGYVKSTTIP